MQFFGVVVYILQQTFKNDLNIVAFKVSVLVFTAIILLGSILFMEF